MVFINILTTTKTKFNNSDLDLIKAQSIKVR